MYMQLRKPIGLGGCGCACGGTCESCGTGLGDTPQEPTIVDKLIGALGESIAGIPVWLLAGAAFIAAGSMLSGGRSRR